MIDRHFQIVLCRNVREVLTLEALASAAGVHPDVVERYVEFGLLEPLERSGQQLLFAAETVSRLRTIQRLRSEIGVNLNGIAVILDLLERIRVLQKRDYRDEEANGQNGAIKKACQKGNNL